MVRVDPARPSQMPFLNVWILSPVFTLFVALCSNRSVGIYHSQPFIRLRPACSRKRVRDGCGLSYAFIVLTLSRNASLFGGISRPDIYLLDPPL